MCCERSDLSGMPACRPRSEAGAFAVFYYMAISSKTSDYMYPRYSGYIGCSPAQNLENWSVRRLRPGLIFLNTNFSLRSRLSCRHKHEQMQQCCHIVVAEPEGGLVLLPFCSVFSCMCRVLHKMSLGVLYVDLLVSLTNIRRVICLNCVPSLLQISGYVGAKAEGRSSTSGSKGSKWTSDTNVAFQRCDDYPRWRRPNASHHQRM